MSAFINQLEKQKKREVHHQFVLPGTAQNAEWLTLQELEGQAQVLYNRIEALLPKNIRLERKGVQLQKFNSPSAKAKMQIRASISATNQRSYMLKIHCHEVNPKGGMTKIARAEYHYKESRLPYS
jgi:hypothetical protein